MSLGSKSVAALFLALSLLQPAAVLGKGGHDLAKEFAPKTPESVGRVVGEAGKKGALFPKNIEEALTKAFPDETKRNKYLQKILAAVNNCDVSEQLPKDIFRDSIADGVNPAILLGILTAPELGASDKTIEGFMKAFAQEKPKLADDDKKPEALNFTLFGVRDQKQITDAMKELGKSSPDRSENALNKFFDLTDRKGINPNVAAGWLLSPDSRISAELLRNGGVDHLKKVRAERSMAAQLTGLGEQWKDTLTQLPKTLTETVEGKVVPTEAGRKFMESLRKLQGLDTDDTVKMSKILPELDQWGQDHNLSFAMQSILSNSPQLNLGHECKERLAAIKAYPFLTGQRKVIAEGLKNSSVRNASKVNAAEAAKHMGALQLLNPNQAEFATAAAGLMSAMTKAGIDPREFETFIRNFPGIDWSGDLGQEKINKILAYKKLASANSDSDSSEWRDAFAKMKPEVQGEMNRRILEILNQNPEERIRFEQLKGPLDGETEALRKRLSELFEYAQANGIDPEVLLRKLKSGTVTGDLASGDEIERLIRPQLALSGFREDKRDVLSGKVADFHQDRNPVTDEEAVRSEANKLRAKMAADSELETDIGTLMKNGYFEPKRKEILEESLKALALSRANLDANPTRENEHSLDSFRKFRAAAKEISKGGSKALKAIKSDDGLKPHEKKAYEAVVRAEAMPIPALFASLSNPKVKGVQRLANEERVREIIGTKIQLKPEDLKTIAEHVGGLASEKDKDKLAGPAQALLDEATKHKLGLDEFVDSLKKAKFLSAEQQDALDAALKKTKEPKPAEPAAAPPETPETKEEKPAPPEVDHAKKLEAELASLDIKPERAKELFAILSSKSEGTEFMKAASEVFGGVGNYEHQALKKPIPAGATDAVRTKIEAENAAEARRVEKAKERVALLNKLLTGNAAFAAAVGGDHKVKQLKEMYDMTGYPKSFFNWVKSGTFPADRPYAKMATEFALSEGIPGDQKKFVEWATEVSGASRFQVLKARFHPNDDDGAGRERWKMMGEIISGMVPADRTALKAKLIASDNPENRRFLSALEAIETQGNRNYDTIPDRDPKDESAKAYFIQGFKESLKRAHDPQTGYHSRLKATVASLPSNPEARKTLLDQGMALTDPYDFAARQARWMSHPADADMKAWAINQANLVAGNPKPGEDHTYIYFEPHPTVVGSLAGGRHQLQPGQLVRVKVMIPKDADAATAATKYNENLLAAMKWIDEHAASDRLPGVSGLRSGKFVIDPPADLKIAPLEWTSGGETTPSKSEGASG